MIEIFELDEEVAEAMISVFGNRIFKFRDDTDVVRLNDNVILKFHNFDSSVRVELGAKMFILEKDNYWRITIE